MTIGSRVRLGCVGLLVLYGCETSSGPVAKDSSQPAPTQVLKNFEMQDIQQGTKSMLLQSIEGMLFEQQHMAELNTPTVTFYKQGIQSSVMRAPLGKIDMQSHEVEAWGGVTVVTPDSATLTTERLRYDPKIKKILSKDAVRLEKPDSITEGEGLEADPDLKVVRIGKQKVHFKQALKS